MKYPLIAPLAALSAGILAAQYAEFSFRELSTSILLLAALAVAALAGGSLRASVVACLAGFALAGALRGSLRSPIDPQRIDQLDLPRSALVRGWVRTPPTVRLDRDQFVLAVESVAGRPATGGLRVTATREPKQPPLDLHYGDRVEFPARLHALRNFLNPGSFDRVGYLYRQQIHLSATARATGVRRMEGRRGSRFLAAVWRAREWAERRADRLMGPHSSNAALVKAMVLGDGAYLDRALGAAFQRTGTYHALVVSGSHVGLLAWISLLVFRSLRLSRGWAAWATFVLILGLVLLVGSQLPILRAALMVSLYLVGRHFHRQRRVLNLIAAAALVMLLWNPQDLFDASFQLSFLSVALIAGVALPILEGTLEPYRLALIDLRNTDRDMHLDPRIAQTRIEWRLWGERVSLPVIAVALRLLIWAGEVAVLSVAVQVGLSLPMAVYFHRVSWSGLSANIFVAPLLSAIVPVGFLAILTGWTLLGQALSILVGLMVAVVEWHARLTWLESRVPAPPDWLGWAVGAGLIVFAWSLHRRRFRLPAAGVLLAAVAALAIHPFAPRLDPGRLELTTLDVGQGEALFLGLPHGRTMLLDAGAARGLDLGEEVVSPYLWSRSIRKLDVVALSHAHADHLGGLLAVLENFPAGELWVGGRNPCSAEYERLLETAARKRLPVIALYAGDTRSLGGVTFQVLWPPRDYVPLPQPANDDSLVLLVQYGERRFLLAGDIEQTPERRLLRDQAVPRLDLLKVPHHGSRTSTAPALLDAAQPWLAVISAGFDNSYRHPHRELLARLEARQIQVWRTDRQGRITVSTDGRRVSVTAHRLSARSLSPPPPPPPPPARPTDLPGSPPPPARPATRSP
jgi:competence protein ComEC